MTEQNRWLTDGEIKVELKKYFTEEVLQFPEPFFTTITEIIAVVRKVQDAKTARIVAEEIEKMFDDEPAPITCIRTHSVENCFTIPVKDWQAFRDRCLK